MAAWYEDDHFWEMFGPLLFTEQRWQAAPIEIDRVLRLLPNLHPGMAVLDLGCGVGRHSLEIKRRGDRVTGVDRTALFLDEARRRAHEEGLAVEFIQDDIRHFVRPGVFSAALSMFTSFGYFEDPADNQQVLANVYQSLRAGGALVLEMQGKETLASKFRERDWTPLPDGFWLEERRLEKDWSYMVNRWIILRDDQVYEKTITHWLYSAHELTTMLKEAGFGEIEIFGDLEGNRYDHTAKRLVAVAYK